MSDLDKEAVLDEFTAAYKKAHGKKPKVEDSNGWYSVDGGKNMRLAQIEEWTVELKSGKTEIAKKASDSSTKKTTKKPAKKSASKKTADKSTQSSTKKSSAKKSSTKKSATKKSTASKSTAKKSQNSKDAGSTPAQAWQAHLEQQAGQSQLPRGFKTD